MTRKRKTSPPYKPPHSGQVLRVIAREFGLRSEFLTDKTAQRYFRGNRVSDKRKAEIITSFGRELTGLGILPKSPFLERESLSLENGFGNAIALYATQWDSLTGYMRNASAPVDRPDLAAFAYLRLVTIDLAIRAASVLYLADLPPPGEETPMWSKSGAGSKYFRELLKRCKPQAPTRTELAERLGVSYNTVDSWLDRGSRPRLHHINAIAEALAPSIANLTEDTLRGKLVLHYALAGICDLLSKQIGRERVMELASALVRFTSRTLVGLRTYSKLSSEDAYRAQTLILLFGIRVEGTKFLLRALWRQESDPLWRTELVATSKPWHLRLNYVMQTLGGLDQAAELVFKEYGIPKESFESAEDDTLRWIQSDPTSSHIFDPSEWKDKTVVRIKGDAKYSARNRMIQYGQASSEGDLESALSHVRRATNLQPENAFYHFHLGATLGLAGKVEEGIQECWIAAQLDPDWELPRVEVGIILLNSNRNQEARNHLENVAQDQENLSAHLAFNLGVARYRCGAYKEALKALNRVIQVSPDHGQALDFAAQCAFKLGDVTRGRQWAKQANIYGQSEAYHKWQAGEYRRRRRGTN